MTFDDCPCETCETERRVDRQSHLIGKLMVENVILDTALQDIEGILRESQLTGQGHAVIARIRAAEAATREQADPPGSDEGQS